MLENVVFDVPNSKSINLVRIHKKKNGDRRIVERGGDVTLDIVGALAKKMSLMLAKKPKKSNLGYVGYNITDVGKLIFIPENYEFRVVKPFD